MRSVIRGPHEALRVELPDDAPPREASPLPPLRRPRPPTRWDVPSVQTAPVVLYQREPVERAGRCTLAREAGDLVRVVARVEVPRGRLGEALRATLACLGGESEDVARGIEEWSLSVRVGESLVRSSREAGGFVPWAYHAPVRWAVWDRESGWPLLVLDGVPSWWPGAEVVSLPEPAAVPWRAREFAAA